jgi:hypothetical protein
VEEMQFLILSTPVINQAVKIPNAPRPSRKLRLRRPRLRRGYAAAGGMPGAFYTGIVKNQERAATELLQIKARGRNAVSDF